MSLSIGYRTYDSLPNYFDFLKGYFSITWFNTSVCDG